MFESIVALLWTLVAVVAVLYLTFRVSRSLAAGATKLGNSRYMKVVDRIVMGPDRMLLIVSIAEKHYLVSSTASGISLLKELSSEEMEQAQKFESLSESGLPGGVKSFQSILQNMLPGKNHQKN